MAVVAGRVYVAVKQTRAIAILSALVLAGNALLSLVLSRVAGPVGLALAGSLAQTVGGVIWLFDLKRVLRVHLWADVLGIMLGTLVAAGAMAVAMYRTKGMARMDTPIDRATALSEPMAMK